MLLLTFDCESGCFLNPTHVIAGDTGVFTCVILVGNWNCERGKLVLIGGRVLLALKNLLIILEPGKKRGDRLNRCTNTGISIPVL